MGAGEFVEELEGESGGGEGGEEVAEGPGVVAGAVGEVAAGDDEEAFVEVGDGGEGVAVVEDEAAAGGEEGGDGGCPAVEVEGGDEATPALVARKDELQSRLEGDPDYYDAKVAGWWAARVSSGPMCQ
ncbi:MAG: hypothetical protein C4321_02080 [Chloroflexota bacterium]